MIWGKKIKGDADLADNREQRAIAGLKRLINEGALQPGVRIPENAVAQSLGLSRTPMRSALKSLEAENWVVRNSAGGYFVREFTLRDVIDMIRLRGSIEKLAIRLAAERGARSMDFVELERLAKAMDDVCEPDIANATNFATMKALNSEFHKLIVQLADSALVVSTLMRTMALPFINMTGLDYEALTKDMRENIKRANKHHHQMIEAIRNGDGDAGVVAVDKHTNMIIETTQAVISSQDGRFH